MEPESDIEEKASDVMHHMVKNKNNLKITEDQFIDFICEKYQIDVAKEYDEYYEQIMNKSQTCTHDFTNFGTLIQCKSCGFINNCGYCKCLLKYQYSHQFRRGTDFKQIKCEACHYSLGMSVCYECKSPTCFCGCPHGCCC